MSNSAVATSRAKPYSGFEHVFIAGRWQNGQSNRLNRDVNPWTGETLTEISQASREDLDAAYASAKEAQRGWAALLPSERAAVMRRAAAVMEARHDEIVQWLVRESGSTKLKASLEWQAVYGVLGEASSLPYLVEGRLLPADAPGKESRVYRKPVGVVALISPWNWPLQLTARSLFPALAVGNAVVVKPASDTPVTGGLLHAKILEEAGLPPGVLNVIVGSGSEIGDAFVTHPTPRVISFTGSTPVGRHIAKLAVESPVIKRVELELGGNSPFVVLEDAELEQTVDAAVFGKFLHQGQICMIVNRFIVHDRLYDAFADRFADRVRQLKVGDPDASDTLIGPVINQSQFDGLVRKIDEARRSGVRELVGGEPRRWVLPPHVFADVTNDNPLARDEIFGPVAPLIRATDEEHALQLANDTPYGLSSTVFTGDVERGVHFAQQVEAGMTHVNDQPVNDLPFSPFGGEKNSGIGRFNGRWAVDAFTTDHWITVQHVPRRYPADAANCRARGPEGREMKPKIGIIGDGNVGSALRRGLERVGYQVRSVGKNPGEVKETGGWADVVILAVPYGAIDEAVSELGEGITGKTLVDVTNALTGDMQLASGCTTSGAETLQRKARGAHVVKAFNTQFASHMDSGALDGQQLTTFAAGDNATAKEQVIQIARDIGFDAVDAGPLQNARLLEPLGYFNIQLGYVLGLGTTIGLKLVHA